MADSDDLNAALSGDKDLAGRDLRGANLSGKDLRNADFTKARMNDVNLDGANLSGAILSGASLFGASARRSILIDATIFATVFQSTDFSDSVCRGARFEACAFGGESIFSGADLRGASIEYCSVQEGARFEGSVVDGTTRFENTEIVRKLAADATFRYYRVERGKLVRRDDTESNTIVDVDSSRTLASLAAQEVLRELEKLRASNEWSPPASAGLGHNNPPEPTPVNREEIAEIITAVTEIGSAVKSVSPSLAQIEKNIETVERSANKIAAWVARKADLASDEFAKQLGKTLADGRLLLAAWLAASGKLTTLIEGSDELVGNI